MLIADATNLTIKLTLCIMAFDYWIISKKTKKLEYCHISLLVFDFILLPMNSVIIHLFSSYHYL